jgi:uncharacterized protein
MSRALGPADDDRNSHEQHPARFAAPSGDNKAPAQQLEVIPYVAPMFAYVAASGLESYLPQVDGRVHPVWYPLAYAAKLAVVMILAWYYRATWRDLRPRPRPAGAVLAVLCGVVVWALWIGLEGHYPTFGFLGKRSGFDPTPLAAGPRWAFILLRLFGLVVVVPVIEELFWRSFLLRWLIDPEFGRVEIGRVTPLAAVLSSVFFALVHPEWLPALLTGLLWAGLLWKTRSLSACVLSHATANLALGLYVLATADWRYW